MKRWSEYGTSAVSRNGDQSSRELIVPDKNGEVHDDRDFRTPMNRPAAPPASVVAENRLKRRNAVYGQNPDESARVQWVREVADYSRLVGEGFQRLAEIELLIA